MRIAIERREIRIALWTVLELAEILGNVAYIYVYTIYITEYIYIVSIFTAVKLAEENQIQTKAVKMRERTSRHCSNKAMISINDIL